jgi:hypothetical protein
VPNEETALPFVRMLLQQGPMRRHCSLARQQKDHQLYARDGDKQVKKDQQGYFYLFIHWFRFRIFGLRTGLLS